MSGTAPKASASTASTTPGTAAPASVPAASPPATPSPIAVSASAARAEASLHTDQLTSILTSTVVHPGGPGTARWEHATGIGLSTAARAAMAWLIADAVVKDRGGDSDAHDLWQQAALAGTKLSPGDAAVVTAFFEDVFGLPGEPEKSLDHMIGHIGEWLWYLHASELIPAGRELLYLEPPKFAVVDSGGDGFAVYRPTTPGDTFYRLWEMKKQTGGGHPSAATSTAYTQLTEHGRRYLARLTAPLSLAGGDVAELGKNLVSLWVGGSERAGLGVSVASDKVPPPAVCFTTMGTRFPQFPHPGQLEGLLVSVEDLAEIAITVREYLWTVL